MEVRHRNCAGLDVHSTMVRVCWRVVEEGGAVRREEGTWGVTTSELEALRSWFQERECFVVGMESTGVYWKPVYHVLSESMVVIVGNPRDMRRGRGHKTDKLDAEWIAELVAHGLVAPSFVPSAEILALRDLTRLRVKLVQDRSGAKNRVAKVLEDANVKLGNVASDLFGKSGRRMLEALVAGERDAQALADLALGLLRKKAPELVKALQGRFTEHHGVLVKMLLEQIDLLDRQIGELDAAIAKAVVPYRPLIERMMTIPGIGETAAQQILAEIGPDATRFGSSKRLASWAGVCPGNEESAGKRKRSRPPKGNRYLRRVLNQCAWSTRQTQTFLGRVFRRMQAKFGGKQAAMVVAHKLLVLIFQLLAHGTVYEDGRYAPMEAKDKERLTKRCVKALGRLGYRVTLEAAPAA